MFTRIVILLIVLAAVAIFAWYMRWRSQKAGEQGMILKHFPLGKVGVIAITTEDCIQCERLQKPALKRLQSQHDDVEVVWRTVDQEPELVKELGIMTVPSTLVRDANGKVVKVNLGYVDDRVLMQQLALVSAPPHCA
ncbi:MAG: TlpA family protein disulfide reductase [Roseiflexaceae bacterium]